MEFYEDPFGFDVAEAKARKERDEALDKGPSHEQMDEGSNVFEDDVSDRLIKKSKSEFEDLRLPNKELNARVEESFRNNPLLKGKSLDKLKMQAYFLVT
jgi:hypothetical protein